MSISPRLSRRRRVFLGTMANVRGGRFLAGGRRKEPRHKMFRADARRALLESIERKEKERKEKAWRIMETCIPLPPQHGEFPKHTRASPLLGDEWPEFSAVSSILERFSRPNTASMDRVSLASCPDRLPLPALVSPFSYFSFSSSPLLSFSPPAFVPGILLPRIEESSRDDREVLLLDAGENFEEGCESKRLCITVCFFWKEKKKERRRNSVVRIVV